MEKRDKNIRVPTTHKNIKSITIKIDVRIKKRKKILFN